MSESLKCYRVFIASPGGLSPERKAFRDTLTECNERDAIQRALLFQPVGWEDTMVGVGRPQALINADIENCDYFVLVLWDRWGTPPDVAAAAFTSGTEEEYHLACDLLTDSKKALKQIVVLFKGVNEKQLSDPGEQLRKVIEFKKKLEDEKKLLWGTFDTVEEFEKLLRKYLSRWIYDHEQATRKPPVVTAATGSAAAKPASRIPEEDRKVPTKELKSSKNATHFAKPSGVAEMETRFARAVASGDDPIALKEYAAFLSHVGRLDHAKTMYLRAIEAARRSEKESALAAALSGLASVYLTQGALVKAEQLFSESAVIHEKLTDKPDLAGDYNNLAIIYRQQGNLTKAEELLQKSLVIFKKEKNEEGIADVYGNLGIVKATKSDFKAAEAYFKQALKIFERLESLEGLANIYGNLGNVYASAKNWDKAEEMHKKSLKIEEKLERPEGIASDLGNLANVYLGRGELDKAEKMYRRVLEMEENLGHQKGIANAYSGIGILLAKKGDFEHAEIMLRKSLAIAERLRDLSHIGNDCVSLGNLAFRRNDFAAARAWWASAIEHYSLLGNTSKVNAVQKVMSKLDALKPKNTQQPPN